MAQDKLDRAIETAELFEDTPGDEASKVEVRNDLNVLRRWDGFLATLPPQE